MLVLLVAFHRGAPKASQTVSTESTSWRWNSGGAASKLDGFLCRHAHRGPQFKVALEWGVLEVSLWEPKEYTWYAGCTEWPQAQLATFQGEANTKSETTKKLSQKNATHRRCVPQRNCPEQKATSDQRGSCAVRRPGFVPPRSCDLAPLRKGLRFLKN